MAAIVAGNFESETQAEKALAALLGKGISADRACSFFVNPPGQHATFPIGGDQNESPGAEHAQSGTATGAAIGGVVGLGVGLAATPFLGPGAAIGGAGVGAYTGALVGTLGTLGDDKHETSAAKPERLSGMIVAVSTSSAMEQSAAADVLIELGARQLEIADGKWESGKWADFDPVSIPKPYVQN